jgi:hypothetical protein
VKRAKKAPKVEKVVDSYQVVSFTDARIAKYGVEAGKVSRGFTYEHSVELAAGVLNSPVFASIPLGAWLLARRGGQPVDALTAGKRWAHYIEAGGSVLDGALVDGEQ